MARDSGRGFFSLNPRRKTLNLLLQPALQLKLPVYLLLVTVGAALLLGGYSHLTFERLFALALAQTDQPQHFQRLFEAQTGDFLVGSAAILTAYVLAVLLLSIAYLHRLVGPTVAFRRHIEALKNGDHSSRVTLRQGDAFPEVADDLNELAEILELGDRARKSSQP